MYPRRGALTKSTLTGCNRSLEPLPIENPLGNSEVDCTRSLMSHPGEPDSPRPLISTHGLALKNEPHPSPGTILVSRESFLNPTPVTTQPLPLATAPYESPCVVITPVPPTYSQAASPTPPQSNLVNPVSVVVHAASPSAQQIFPTSGDSPKDIWETFTTRWERGVKGYDPTDTQMVHWLPNSLTSSARTECEDLLDKRPEIKKHYSLLKPKLANLFLRHKPLKALKLNSLSQGKKEVRVYYDESQEGPFMARCRTNTRT